MPRPVRPLPWRFPWRPAQPALHLTGPADRVIFELLASHSRSFVFLIEVVMSDSCVAELDVLRAKKRSFALLEEETAAEEEDLVAAPDSDGAAASSLAVAVAVTKVPKLEHTLPGNGGDVDVADPEEASQPKEEAQQQQQSSSSTTPEETIVLSAISDGMPRKAQEIAKATKLEKKVVNSILYKLASRGLAVKHEDFTWTAKGAPSQAKQEAGAAGAAGPSSNTTAAKPENAVVALDTRRFVSVSSFHGKSLVDIREFYVDGGELKPGKKGISLTTEQWEKLGQDIDGVSNSLPGATKEAKTIVDLSAKRRLSVVNLGGGPRVDIREYYVAEKEGGALKPGKRGISLTADQWEKLIASTEAVNEALSRQ